MTGLLPAQNLAVSSSYDDRRVLVLPPQSRVSTQSAAYSRDVSGKGPSGRNWSALRMVQGCTKRISAPCGMDPAGNGSNTPGPGVGCTQVVEHVPVHVSRLSPARMASSC